MTVSRSGATDVIEESSDQSSEAGRFTYDVRDDRQGYWTRLEYVGNLIVVRPTKAYLRGYWVGMGFILCLACLFATAAIRILDYPWSMLALLGIILFAVLKIRKQYRNGRRRMNTPFLMICDERPSVDVPVGCNVVQRRDVECVRLRASSSTDSNDLPRWQTYLHIKGDDRGILIHQAIRWGRTPDLSVASDFAKRLGVPLVGV